MNQTVQLNSPKIPASFMLEEEVVNQLLAKAQASVTTGRSKTASEYVNRLVKAALENDKE